MKKPGRAKVLFVCIGNSCRSPMAEAIARRDAAQEIEPSSAGTAPLGFVAGMTTETLVRNGYPVEGLTSKAILREAWDAADIVINMSGRPRELAFRAFPEYGKVEDWYIEDPYGDPDKYQGTFEAIHRHVAELTERLRSRAASRTEQGQGLRE
jgi:protein-tyrosine-phosphatase